MKTTIEFYYEADYSYGLIITSEVGNITLRINREYDFKTIGTSMYSRDAYICGDFCFKIYGNDVVYSATVEASGFTTTCYINKNAYVFLKNIDLDKFVKLNLKVEFPE